MEGESLTCRLFKGGKIQVTLEDRVYPDMSCGQWEAGWWVYTTLKHPDHTEDWFLSESGILYGYEYDPTYQVKGYTKPVGIHVPWAKRVKKMDAELEQTVRDELTNQGRKHEV